MVDDELIDAIHKTIAKGAGLSQISNSQAVELLDTVARRFVADPAHVWWWGNLKVPHKTIPYGESDGLEEIAHIVPPKAGAFLVITDDEPRPWPVFSGTTSDLLAALRDIRFCEYFLIDPGFNWLVFDTHHNAFVVTGSLIGEAGQTNSGNGRG